MRNCIIVGAGRSGTSMVAGTLAGVGYFMGEDLHPPREANPKGFFEGPEIKLINERLLEPVIARPQRAGPSPIAPPGSRWLAPVEIGAPIAPTPELEGRMRTAASRAPFAYKDPRFCYTLGAWRAILPEDTVFICVFREPARTANSTLKERSEAPYLRDMSLTYPAALTLWTLMYRHVLDVHSRSGSWLFVHYDQLLDGSAFARMERHLGTPVDRAFADPALKRSCGSGPVDAEASRAYAELCRRSRHSS
jgi:hypothetical protein